MKDYIEREKVFKDLLDQCKITGYGGLTPNDIKYVFSLQTNADVRPVVRGEWICLYDGNYKCSECGEWYSVDVTPIEAGMFYCPNCGADVGGERDE